MKSPMYRLLGVFLTLLTLNLDLRAAAPGPDPLIGKWFWHHNIQVEFHADGTATSDVNSSGTWEYLNNPEVQRNYRVNWDHGKFIDTIILNEDGTTAVLVSSGKKYNIRRMTD